MSSQLSNNTEIKVHEAGLDLANGDNMLLEREVQALKAYLEKETLSSKKLNSSLAERDQRIAELELALKETADKMQDKIAIIQRIRVSCEEDARQVAQIKVMHANTLDLCDSRIGELMDMMNGVEDGVRKIYQSRRWRFANIVLWIKGLFYSQEKRPFRGYWRIDNRLAEYRVWRDRYLSKSDEVFPEQNPPG